MPGLYDHEEIPLPLVRRVEDRSYGAELSATHVPDDDAEVHTGVGALGAMDRMRPGTSGGLAGFFAGAAALGVVQAMAPSAILGPIHAAAAHWGVSLEASFAVAYGTAAAIGALVGACFAGVTRYLRRWLPLVVWALVFFGSVTVLLLALSRTYGRGIGVAYAPAILAASAAYAFVASFALPIRKRG